MASVNEAGATNRKSRGGADGICVAPSRFCTG